MKLSWEKVADREKELTAIKRLAIDPAGAEVEVVAAEEYRENRCVL